MHYENLSEEQKETLKNFVTNTHSNIFALQNLPEVIKGALFSRYSRSTLGLRSLLIKDFIVNKEADFTSIVGEASKKTHAASQMLAIQKAQDFYDRILDGYGDDSIGELGGAHLACEQVSMLAAKVLEDCRIGGSPLEKSTRYVYFDQKQEGKYAYYREPKLMASSFAAAYEETCDHLFDTYGQLAKELTEIMETQFPHDPEISPGAYRAALRAKVLDCLRGLLPAGTMTNMGIYGNGRFFEAMIQKLHVHPLAEIQDIGQKSYEELHKILPSFVRRAEKTHRHCQGYREFMQTMHDRIGQITEQHAPPPNRDGNRAVNLIEYDKDAAIKVAAALLFEQSESSLKDLTAFCATLSSEDRAQILKAAASSRKNRRHKGPRALEHAYFTFEIVADYGAYRDLQRHRILTQERQLLTCYEGYTIPEELVGTPLEARFRSAMERAKEQYLAISVEFPQEAQYIVPMGYHIRWYKRLNLRALQWLCELRSTPQGHCAYRFVAQAMAERVCQQFPEFTPFFSFVDYEGYTLGRLDQEIRIDAKRQS